MPICPFARQRAGAGSCCSMTGEMDAWALGLRRARRLACGMRRARLEPRRRGESHLAYAQAAHSPCMHPRLLGLLCRVCQPHVFHTTRTTGLAVVSVRPIIRAHVKPWQCLTSSCAEALSDDRVAQDRSPVSQGSDCAQPPLLRGAEAQRPQADPLKPPAPRSRRGCAPQRAH